MRVVKTTSEPSLMFCASPVDGSQEKPTYRVDYTVGSKSAPAVISSGTPVSATSIVYSCRAIGQTNHAHEAWDSAGRVSVECVGIPGFVGTLYPRVAGIIRFRIKDAGTDPLSLRHGDVLSPVGSRPKVICQLVNDQARVWGGGVAHSAAAKFPGAQHAYAQWLMAIPKRERLGRVHIVDVGNSTSLASLVAQEGYGPSATPRIRYAPLERCFTSVAKFALDHNADIHMPRIGVGASGGTWNMVEEIVRDAVIARGVNVTVYDLPPKRQQIGTGLLI